MAAFNKRTRYVLFGVGIGAGVVLLTPILAPVVVAVARPLTKALLKQMWLTLERSHEGAVRFWEGVEDLVAEVRDEVDGAMRARGGARTVEVAVEEGTVSDGARDTGEV